MAEIPASEEQTLTWSWNGVPVTVGLSRRGAGPTALLLPAPSSISTRHEMAALQERLAQHFQTVSVDWPGFGDLPRPAVDWTPQAMEAFLPFLLGEVSARPAMIVAAGHAAGYVLHYAAHKPSIADRLVLITPTWCGPLPTMMQARKPWFATARRYIDMPVVGPLLYRLNVNRLVVRRMGAGHVYVDKGWLAGERLGQKLAVTTAPGARHASVRFVTGALDPFASRDEFLAAARASQMPITVVYGADTPPRSRAEIEALREVDGIDVVEVPRGKLSLHEEFPDLVHAAILERLGDRNGSGSAP